ncbi:MAG: signal peptidase I [Chlamydiia bacterium]|nr:signal peptidase I [Chlamydiia bacterium]MCP5505428.1 signal peptidase I [Chlamydiales bacterium]
MKEYSLRRSKKILLSIYRGLKTKKDPAESKQILPTLKDLQEAILNRQRSQASILAQNAETLFSSLPRKNPLLRLTRFLFGLGLALLAAVLIRQMWFELYEIPTGSMRPTFKEKDRVLVSKSKFGINFPLKTKHFYFDDSLCKRMGIIVFTVENMNTADSEMLYFYLFPGKKQYIKRLIGKPGDTLYFYGGLIYGVDKEGNDISYELQQFSSNSLEHIPFIRFEGTKLPNQFSPQIALNQMGANVAKISFQPNGKKEGYLLSTHLLETASNLNDYYDLWGFKNFAISRLVLPSYLDPIEKSYLNDLSSYSLVLELHHSPSVKNLIGSAPSHLINKAVSYLPLTDKHCRTLFDHLYTARFVVKNESVYRYGGASTQSNVKLSGIPNGTYEFYHGVAYQIYPTGVSKKLPITHPIYSYSIERLLTFYNLGIEWNHHYLPKSKNDFVLPSRYAYFREGDLYLLGYPILKAYDLELDAYNKIELKKKASFYNYHPFIDRGPPIKQDGTLDLELIKACGLTVPEKHYLALGDNHAMSGDSRDFGFVPEENIKGTPSVIFWPPGNRFGFPSQSFIPFFSLPNILVYTLGALSIALGSYFSKRKNRFPISF